jgi:hypothetical protein
VSLIGGLIGESLRTGAALEGLRLTVTKVSRIEAGDVDAGQPRLWTFVEFEADERDIEALITALERTLEKEGGWYCDFRTDDETFVVFAGRAFRYPRGDAVGRAAAADYARSVGVPEAQLDWPV